jgi:hypothetical protein
MRLFITNISRMNCRTRLLSQQTTILASIFSTVRVTMHRCCALGSLFSPKDNGTRAALHAPTSKDWYSIIETTFATDDDCRAITCGMDPSKFNLTVELWSERLSTFFFMLQAPLPRISSMSWLRTLLHTAFRSFSSRVITTWLSLPGERKVRHCSLPLRTRLLKRLAVLIQVNPALFFGIERC